MHRVISDLRTLVFGALVSALVSAGASAQATLTSDQADYAPGTTAVLTGAGFAANETVALQVVHADGDPPAGADHEVWYVDSDDQGGFVTTWHVCEDDCVGETLLATAAQQSGAYAETTFTDTLGTGTVRVDPVGGACVGQTEKPNQEFWEVEEGGLYQMTLSNVTECTGDTITVFVQFGSIPNGNFCFNATGGAGRYVGTFTVPDPACNTMPVSYKCGADAPCDNHDTFAARASDGTARTVHLRASIFDADCKKIADDTNCDPDGCTPCILVCPPNTTVECSASTDPSATGTPTGCAATATFDDDVTLGDCDGSYVITRHWSADDGCGGTTTCDQIITVVDTTDPTLDASAEDKTVECDGSGNQADLAAWLASHGGAAASDACSDVDWSDDFTGLTDDCGATGSATVTFTATDDCGNSVDTTATFTIEDTTDPTIDTQASNQTVECDGAGNQEALQAWLDSQGGAAASDGCSGVTWSNDFKGLSDGCGETGSATVTFTAKDDCGNSADTVATFTIEDTTPPTISCPDDAIGYGHGECCVDVDLGEPTADDGCSGVTVEPDNSGPFCIGDTIVTWTATDGCGLTATCEQTVTVLGQICAIKYYDANANNVQDNGEVGIAGWDIVLTPGNVHQTTDATGKVVFDVPTGNYTVSEGTPTQTNWVHTGPTSVDVTIDSSHCSATASFGNYCFSTPSGGFTLGYWTNKNGEKALNGLPVKAGGVPCWVSTLNGMACFRNANGTLHTFTNYADLKTWLINGTATNMAYMLSVQLASNVLSGLVSGGLSGTTIVVVPGKVTTGNGVCIVPFLSVPQAITCGVPPLLSLTSIPGTGSCGCTSNNGLVTVADLRSRACCLLQAYGTTTAASTQRTYQECVKNILDMLNNNGNNGYPCGGVSQFINPDSSKCPATFN